MPIAVDDDDDVTLLGIKPPAEIPVIEKPVVVAASPLPSTNSKRTLLTMPTKTPATQAATTATTPGLVGTVPTPGASATSEIGRKRSHEESTADNHATPTTISSSRPAQAAVTKPTGAAPAIHATTLTEKVLAKSEHGPAGQDPSRPSFYTKGGDGVSKMDLLAFDFDRKRRGELPPSAVAVNVVVNGPMGETPKDRKLPKIEASSPSSGVVSNGSSLQSSASSPKLAAPTSTVAATTATKGPTQSAATPQRTLSGTSASPAAPSTAAPKGQMKLDSFFAKFACQKKPAAAAPSDAPAAE